MVALKDEYRTHVTELRDAGLQLKYLYQKNWLKSRDPDERHRVKRCVLETELYVLKLDELIETLDRD